MGCGASVLSARNQHSKKTLERAYSAAVNSLRVQASGCSEDQPLPVGDVRILQQADARDIRDYYVMGRILGKGQFGTCRMATHRATGEKLACKSISKRRLASLVDVMDVRREVQVMYHLAGHPNIVTIKDAFEDRGYVHLIEELCSGGELFDSIVERGHYSEKDAAAAFRSITSVVAHCHNMGVMHRDIKPENFLLSSRQPGAAIKATDFGLSCFFAEGQMFNEVMGSAFYVAPEVLRKKYDKRADIWSLGVLLYILLSGNPPFYAETERDIFQAILHAEVSFAAEPWPSISEGAKDVVRRMLERNVAVRASAAEVLAHEWVRENGSAESRPLHNEVLVRLQNFAALNKLQQEALKVIATHLPESEITGLRALFLEMDADGSGSITVEELRQALQRKGTRIPSEELQRIMAQADISGDGTLDYEEFLAATMSLSKLEHEEHLYTAFKFFDTDGSGYITRDELAAALSGTVCSEAEIDRLMAQADRSGDGRIDYSEFCDLMRSGQPNLVTATRVIKQGIMKSTRAGKLWKPQQQQQQQQPGQQQQQQQPPQGQPQLPQQPSQQLPSQQEPQQPQPQRLKQQQEEQQQRERKHQKHRHQQQQLQKLRVESVTPLDYDGTPPAHPSALSSSSSSSSSSASSGGTQSPSPFVPPDIQPLPQPLPQPQLPPIKTGTVTGMIGPKSRTTSAPGDGAAVAPAVATATMTAPVRPGSNVPRRPPAPVSAGGGGGGGGSGRGESGKGASLLAVLLAQPRRLTTRSTSGSTSAGGGGAGGGAGGAGATSGPASRVSLDGKQRSAKSKFRES